MSGGGSDSKVRSKISRGSSDNETEWITDMDSGGANEDWCRNEGPRPSTLALRGLKGFATQLDSRHHVAERVLTLPVPHALNLRSTTPRGQFFFAAGRGNYGYASTSLSRPQRGFTAGIQRQASRR